MIIPALGDTKIDLEPDSTDTTFRNYNFINAVLKQVELRGWVKFSVQWSDDEHPPSLISTFIGVGIYPRCDFSGPRPISPGLVAGNRGICMGPGNFSHDFVDGWVVGIG